MKYLQRKILKTLRPIMSNQQDAVLSTHVKAIFVSHRRGRRTIKPQQAILKINNVFDGKTASKYLGNAVMLCYKNSRDETIKVNGYIRAVHGDKGAVRAKFEKNLNPQWVGKDVLVKLYKVDILSC